MANELTTTLMSGHSVLYKLTSSFFLLPVSFRVWNCAAHRRENHTLLKHWVGSSIRISQRLKFIYNSFWNIQCEDILFSLQLASQRAQSFILTLYPRLVCQRPLFDSTVDILAMQDFYFFFLVYFQDDTTDVFQWQFSSLLCVQSFWMLTSFKRNEIPLVSIDLWTWGKAAQCQTKIYRALASRVGLGPFLHSETFLPHWQVVCRQGSSPQSAIFSCGFEMSDSIHSDFQCLR